MSGTAYHDNAWSVTTNADDIRIDEILNRRTHFERSSPDKPITSVDILKELGFAKPKIQEWLSKSKDLGSTVDDEILSEGYIEERAYYGAIARKLRLPYLNEIDSHTVHYSHELDRQLRSPRLLKIYPRDRSPLIVIAPEIGKTRALNTLLESNPSLKGRVAIASRSAIKRAIWDAGASERSRKAVTQLSEALPQCSVRTILVGRQGFVIGMLVGGVTAALASFPSNVLLIAHVFCTSLFTATNFFRLAALIPRFHAKTPKVIEHSQSTPVPFYSVLVPVHRERQVIPQLVRALEAIDWPRSRLEIKIICEADDRDTIAALEDAKLKPCFEIVRVPPSQPRTKPKALQYALPSVRGDYVTIYDAEDRPHPKQLREAHSRFESGPKNLACLQAPLVITNIGQSWISSNFAMEYAGLFRRILPMLASLQLPLPLGGTSNHFKTSALRDVGGWDPYNVTEDADLGMRLSSAGYSVGVIRHPTLEDAPTELSIWLKQRTRWFKGWIKTWLVMTRHPIKLLKEIGAISFLTSQVMILGMVTAALFHPLILSYLLIAGAAIFKPDILAFSNTQITLFTIDIVNLLTSYVGFWALANYSMTANERIRIGSSWLRTPIYWMLLTVAAWRAIWELKQDPFRWNKTPHKPSK